MCNSFSKEVRYSHISEISANFHNQKYPLSIVNSVLLYEALLTWKSPLNQLKAAFCLIQPELNSKSALGKSFTFTRNSKFHKFLYKLLDFNHSNSPNNSQCDHTFSEISLWQHNWLFALSINRY